ncbi:RloB family protein [Umezawaea endophytica]|uniref:RloB family protein n=1 Tax=Umezawaea endophytica TaxID=1654476 RepID=A0A9X2VY51_9PSEU|nr:RloB family protein [Umezawaea endophytica]MCS7484819.1 RloB family protein [Umezawaea endophytica]
MSPRRREARSLKRVPEKRRELRTIVVFTEGKNSEPEYITGLKKLPQIADNVAMNLIIHPEHGVPLTLVELALDRKHDKEVDELWCIFDVEWPKHHPNLDEAITLATKNDIKLAISNPCFELWLILHHKDYNKFCNTGVAESASRKLDGRAGKSIDPSVYIPLRKVAAKRAKALESRHESNETRFPHDNPSSGMHSFLQSLEGDEYLSF